MLNQNKYLIVIAGPTAIGKTALSITLAQHYKTEILSADSRQFYREMRIGTAYPDAEQLTMIPHHFIGNLSIRDDYNVSRYEKEALSLLDELFSAYDVLILTGGSGLYIDAICKGIDDLPDYDPVLRKQLKKELNDEGLEPLVARLKQLDPEYYAIVDRQNPNRVLRAVEVCLQTGKTYTSLRTNEAATRPFKIIKIGLNTDRDMLFRRIGSRVDEMMERGLLDEARSLFKYREYNALNTVGYKELFAFLQGDVSLEDAVEKVKTNTRRYAKRQLTWFKRDTEMKWFRPDETKAMIAYIDRMMGD